MEREACPLHQRGGAVKISEAFFLGQRRGASRTKTRNQTGNIPRLWTRRNHDEQAGNIHLKYHAFPGKIVCGDCPDAGSVGEYRSLLYPQASAGGCGSKRLPELRKASAPDLRQKSQAVLLRPLSKRMVEQSPRKHPTKSVLQFYLRVLWKEV